LEIGTNRLNAKNAHPTLEACLSACFL